ncbi:MAG: hypothetical protein RIG82_07840 [Phycisphaeraceae bacterium]
MSLSIEKYREEHGDEGGGLCPHCLAAVGRFDHFCPECARPITAHASTGPLEQVYAAGSAYRGAVDGSPRFVVVLGLWLVFAPGIVVSCLMTLAAAGALMAWMESAGGDSRFHGEPLIVTRHVTLDAVATIGAPLLGLAVVALQVIILWKVTGRYVASRADLAVVEDPEVEDDVLAKEALSYLSEEEEAAIERVEEPVARRMDPLIALGLIVLIVGLVVVSLALIGPEFFPAG